MKPETRLFKRYERIWHWAQAFLILGLAATGFEVHGTLRLFGFEKAVSLHETMALLLVVLTLFTMFWHATTGEGGQFVPTKHRLAEQIRFYTIGIFLGETHLHEPTPENKFNPVQKLAYLSLLLFIFPVQIAAGVLYWGAPFWPKWIAAAGGLRTVAMLHTAGAFAMLCFLIVHLYMLSTGKGFIPHVKSMVTGRAGH